MSPTTPTSRRNGICSGYLIKHHCASQHPPSRSHSLPSSAAVNESSWISGSHHQDGNNERSKSNDYCVLIGNTLFSYTDASSYLRGDYPTSEVRIVGASAWNPPSFDDITVSTTFHIVTFASTHIYCSAPSPSDRDLWLSSLHSGLEASYALFQETLLSCSEGEESMFKDRLSPDSGMLDPPAPRVVQRRKTVTSVPSAGEASTMESVILLEDSSITYSSRYCISCGRYPPDSLFRSTSCPCPQYGYEGRVDLCADCLAAQGVLSHVLQLCGLYASHAHERAALLAARDAAVQAVQQAMGSGKTSTDSNHVGESSSGVLSNSTSSLKSGVDDGWTDVHKDISTHEGAPSWHHVSPTDTGTKALLALIRTPGFETFRRRSRALEYECKLLEAGRIGSAIEFLDILADKASAVAGSTQVDAFGENPITGMKKEAFKVAGDMSAAIRLLHDHALPGYYSSSSSPSPAAAASSVDMLACILEFLLDLCEEGELPTVAFFWPQLRHIHLQMLPAGDADALVRAELFEDFLITVSARYSVHLALELVWGLLADLEESMEDYYTNTTTAASSSTPSTTAATAHPACRARRFAVLRFVCELESILFDFESGWGGGSVSLRGMLAPSHHQAQLTKDAIALLQLHRRFSGHYLTRSVRLDKLRHEARMKLKAQRGDDDDESEEEEKERDEDCIPFVDFNSSTISISSTTSESFILNQSRSFNDGEASKARDTEDHLSAADYFSAQLAYVRRLGDIAEKLRFLDIEKREPALVKELEYMNVSKRCLGGDPLSRAGQGISRVVHLPCKEGHVFRSKERTPVLLLMEVVRPIPEQEEEVEVEVEEGKEELSSLIEEQENFSEEDYHGNKIDDSDNDSADLPMESPKAFHGNASDIHVLKSPKYHCKLKRLGNQIETAASPLPHSAANDKEMEDLVASALKNQLSLDINSEPPPPPFIEDESTKSNEIETNTEKESMEPTSKPSIPNVRSSGAISKLGSTDAPRSKRQPRSSTTERNPFGRQHSFPRISPFGSLGSNTNYSSNPSAQNSSSKAPLAAFGEGRREVLTTILAKGMRGNVIAKGAAAAAQLAVQAMDRQRAVKLIMSDDDDGTNATEDTGSMDASQKKHGDVFFHDILTSVQSNAAAEENVNIPVNEDDETMEALRLLLIQHRVAHGKLTPEKAVMALAPVSTSTPVVLPDDKDDNDLDGSSEDITDAGEVDPRLAGCGPLSPAILSALKLWQGGIVSNGELIELAQKDLKFVLHSALLGNVSKLKEDSAFWVRFAFGERWAEKKARIATASPYGTNPCWDLVGVIVKSNDDLRQEAFVMQLIELCQEAFMMAGLELWVQPYRILATGRKTGIIETVRNALSFDSLKKRPGYGKGGLRAHFQRMTEFDANPSEAFQVAQRNFVRSLAAYSLMSYFFMFKDRHNGNLLLDTAGHVIHIDFGFVFGIAPGGSFSLEMSTPFKLTDEMLEVMGGIGSPLFSEFVTLFCCGFLALQAHVDTFCTLVEVTCKGSTFKCFEGKDPTDIIDRLRERFRPEFDKGTTVAYALDLIKTATSSFGTKQYDFFQYMSQGIAS